MIIDHPSVPFVLQFHGWSADEIRVPATFLSLVGEEERAGIRMAQSESATCSGLWSAQEGFRTFDMETGGWRLENSVSDPGPH